MAGVNSSDPTVRSPFGQVPYQQAGILAGTQLDPLLRGLGFGGGRGFADFEQRLGQAGGPLASLIRGVQGFAGNVIPQAQGVGADVSARGSEAFTTLQNQVNQALSQLPFFQQAGQQATSAAEQFTSQAFDPTRDQPLFQEASRRLLEQIRPGLAARGLEGGGSGEKAESDALRDLSLSFAQSQRADQLSGINALTNAGAGGAGLAAAGVPIASQLGQGVNTLAQQLSAQYGIPLQAAGSLMELLTSPQRGGLGLLQATGPSVGTESKGVKVL